MANVVAQQVPLLDLKAQYRQIKDELDAAVQRVFASQHFILGPEVSGLENEICAYTGAAYAVGVSSGTDALLAALMVSDVGPGDEVITTPYSFFATAGVVARLHARPVFVDIDADTFNARTDLVEQAITKKTKAIIPVHLYGRVDDMRPLERIAQERGVPFIEDAAQAIGATDSEGRQAGTVGAIGCFSFFPSKNLGGAGDGGMVVTNDATLAHKLRICRVHGGEPKYYHQVVGGNFRLDALQAAVLRVRLRHLDDWTEGRRQNAQRYRELFASTGLEQVVTPQDHPGHIYNQFVLRVERRDKLREYLTGRGVGTEIYYPVPLHLQQCFRELGYQKGDFPESERAAAQTIALPIYPELTAEQIEYVVETIVSFYRG